MEMIRQYLGAGEKDSDDLRAHLASHGCRAGTIRRARARCKLQKRREGFGPEGRWVVRLPHAG